MTINKQIHLKWNWQLSSSPEQLWLYIADTNRLFKDLNMPSIQPTDVPYHLETDYVQLSFDSIQCNDVWTDEPCEWEYPYRYGVKRKYKNGPYKEVKIQVDLLPNRKGTRLQYQFWAVPNLFVTAVLSTLKHKIIQRARLKNVFRYYDELVKQNRLPYETRFKKNLLTGDKERLNEIRETFINAIDVKKMAGRVVQPIHQLKQHSLLKKFFKYVDKFVEQIRCLSQVVHSGKRLLHRYIKKLGNIVISLAADLRKVENRLVVFTRQVIPHARLKRAVRCHWNKLIEKGGPLYQLKKRLIRRVVQNLDSCKKNLINAITLQDMTDRLIGIIQRIVQYSRLEKIFRSCSKFVKRRFLQLQTQFKKKLNGIRKNLINAVDNLKRSIDKLFDFTQRIFYRTRLREGFRYIDELVIKTHRLYHDRLRKKIPIRRIKRLYEMQKNLINKVDLKGTSDWLAKFIDGVIKHPLLKKAAYYAAHYYDKLAEQVSWQRQVWYDFNKRLLRWGIKKLTGVRKVIAAGLKDITYHLVAFIHQTIPQTVSHYRKLFETYFRLYRIRLKKSLVRSRSKRLYDIRKILIDITDLKNIVDRLVDFIQQADDIDLIRIEPYQLADYWQFERENVLFVFLHAANEGLLNFNWDLYCPSCRTVQQTCKALNEVHEPVFCSDCSSDFSISFNQSIQLSFSPSPLVRKIDKGKYCSANPRSKPHIAIQQYLKTNQKRYLKTHLEEGIYHLWTTGSKGNATIVVTDDGQDTVKIQLSGSGIQGEQVEICQEPNLIFENSTQKDQFFILEKASWHNTGVTAAQVTSLQVFRDLFAQEVPQKGEKIAVDKLTLMFTDLFDSTAMYHKEGDSHAVGRVLEHFEILQQAVTKENGALVKTIGDSVMAVFSSPAQALRAFLTAQKKLVQDKRFGESFKLKAGIHHGRCVAVNLNSRIDYFGSTVNIASRLADLANENEIIISENVSNDEWVHQLLENNDSRFTLEQECASLKGFDREVFNIKRIRFEKSPLRLAI